MKFLVAATALVAIASPALAQDEQSAFSGPYIGAYVGYDHIAIKDAASGQGGNRDGVGFGALAGYNLDLGGAVVGIEGEWGDSSTSAQEPDVFSIGDSLKLSANRDLFIGGRIGMKATPKTLVYAKGGYANTRMTLTYTDPANTVSEASDTIDGYRIGGGVEFAATDRILLRGEYRYSNYSEYKYQGTPTGLEANRHQVLFGVVGKF